MSNSKRSSVSNLINDDIRFTVLSNMFEVLFEQVRLQQEVRDRWFGHYLTIIGAISAVATLCLKLFENSVNKHSLYRIVGMIFIFAGSIGILFYILYLNQRHNYRKQYSQLSIIQNIILSSVLSKSEFNRTNNTFTTRTKGADFYTLLIENIISSTCFAIGILFILNGICPFLELLITAIAGSLTFLISAVFLLIIRSYYERRQ